jgi:hypothetical protein
MKRLIIILSAIVAGATMLESPAEAEVVTIDEAWTVAQNWTRLIVHLKGHWHGSQNPKIEDVQKFQQGKRSLGYICSIDPEGFIIVSLRKEFAPVKVYSTHGNLDPESNIGMSGLIKGRMKHVHEIVEKKVGSIATAKSSEMKQVLEADYQEPWGELLASASVFEDHLKSKAAKTNYKGGEVLLSSEWSQGAPYNDQCPVVTPCGTNAISGCVAIAGAQTARYWNWPPYGVENPCDDSYDWPNMTDTLSTTSPPTNIAAVAELVWEMGWAVDMDWGCDSSGALFADEIGEDLRDVFEEHFRYNIAADAEYREDYGYYEWFNLLKEQLNLNRPLPYRIPGHVIVVDGWQEVDMGWGIISQYHMNYGWGGSVLGSPEWNGYTNSNVWFTVDALPGGDLPEERVLMNLHPSGSVGDTVAGIYSRNSSFPYRYFDLDATGSNAMFQSGQYLQFLEGVEVRGTGNTHTAEAICFEGTASFPTHLYTRGDPSLGIKIISGSLKLGNGGRLSLMP